jgi:regulator of sirC expression with transglutaminase-like and TPR domain
MRGRLLTHPAAARQRFRDIATGPEELIDLTEASLVIALEQYPWLHVEHYLDRIDAWSEAIRGRVEGSRDVERIVEEINRFLYEQEGFHGEGEDLYDPRYTFLNEVLDRHAGLPIALSILYIEISRRIGITVSGVALPGRFLVKVSGAWGEILIDPFDSGRILSTVECQRIMDEVFGGAVKLREHHLRAASKREILEKLLAHLKSIYMAQHDIGGAAGAIDRLLMLDMRDPYELRDRGILAMQMHSYREAIDFLERYLEIAPFAEDRALVREQIEYLRAWLDQN